MFSKVKPSSCMPENGSSTALRVQEEPNTLRCAFQHFPRTPCTGMRKPLEDKMGAYADVAIPTGVDKLFTYHIPSDLQTSARIGTRVLVPFGRKWTTGLIVHLPTASSLPSLKSIADVLDPEPVVSPDLLHLCQWIAGYYVAPLAEVLKAALPHGFSSASKRRIHAAVPLDDQTIRDAKKRAPKRAAILSLLQVEGAMWASELQKRVGLKSINAVLNDMVHQGLVRSEEVLPRAKLKAKTHDVLLLHDINAELLSHTLQNLSPRKRKTRELLQAITRWRDQAVEEIAVLDLLKQSKTSSRVFAEAQALCDLPVLKKRSIFTRNTALKSRRSRSSSTSDRSRFSRRLPKESKRGSRAPFYCTE